MKGASGEPMKYISMHEEHRQHRAIREGPDHLLTPDRVGNRSGTQILALTNQSKPAHWIMLGRQ